MINKLLCFMWGHVYTKWVSVDINYEIGMGGVGIGTPFVADQRPRTLLEHARGGYIR